MPRAYVSVGSNIDREDNVRSGLAYLRERYGDLRVSPVYESEAVGFLGSPFYNLVVGFDAQDPLDDICKHLLAIELQQGRRRGRHRFCPRTLDLDLLLYGHDVRRNGRCRVPRPEILEHAFVLRPLADVAPTECHPELGLSFGELWERFDAVASPLRRVAFHPLEA
jgi:2-amino-4-hydroxy-6-hydroxymethyldihydropteridine diphosphokinase